MHKKDAASASSDKDFNWIGEYLFTGWTGNGFYGPELL